MPYLDDVLNPYQSLTGDLTAVDTLSATLTNEGELTGYIAISDVAPVSLALNDLTDVEITEPENNEVLTYNSELSKWENKPAQGGGGSSDYTDLTNKPQINSVTLVGNLSSSDLGLFSGDYNDLTNKPTLATVATTGDYDDLTNKPTIPAAQVNADWDAVSGVASILNKPALATVATTGDYDDLTNKPTIPDELTDLSDTNITSPSDGQILKYDGNTSKWVNGTGGGGSSTLAGLSDVDLGSTYQGQFLVYDGSAWKNYRLGDTAFPVGAEPAGKVLKTIEIVGSQGAVQLDYLSYNDLTDKPVIPSGNYSATEHVVGKWTDGTTDVYELTVNLPSTVSCSAGNTSAAGAWTHLYNWTDDITIIDFKAWNDTGSTGKTYWGHLSAQWSSSNNDIRALNIRSTACGVDGFTMRYIKNV